MHFFTRPIVPSDNLPLARIIRNALEEFGANKPGTVYDDPTTDNLFELFQAKGAAYFVAEWNGAVVGGAGIFPTDGLPVRTCELVKMYLASHARGKGIAQQLIQQCIDRAMENQFQQIYLESMPELARALKIYERFGFTYLDGPLGNSGHTGCSLWMIRDCTLPKTVA